MSNNSSHYQLMFQSVVVLTVDVLEVDVLEVDVLEVDVLEVDQMGLTEIIHILNYIHLALPSFIVLDIAQAGLVFIMC